jgi:hypothetical protein
MTNLVPFASLDNVVQLETSTAALGGAGAPMNQQGQALLNRTAYIIAQLANYILASEIGIANGIAPLGSDGKLSASFLPSSVLGQVTYQGTWDASSGSPPSGTPSKGQYWIVSIAGSTNLGGITSWNVGDWAIYDVHWDKVDNTDAVSSVAGLTGIISTAALQTALGLGSLAYLATVNNSNWSGTALALTNGGTGATSATAARAALGAAGNADANVFVQQQAVTPARGTITGAVSINLANLSASTGVTWTGTPPTSSNNLHLTLSGNVISFALTNPVDGAVYNIRFIQDATGGRTMPALPSAFKFSGGIVPVFSSAANAVDFMSAEYGATSGTYMCSFLAGMA